jgi:hypothetical protein
VGSGSGLGSSGGGFSTAPQLSSGSGRQHASSSGS